MASSEVMPKSEVMSALSTYINIYGFTLMARSGRGNHITDEYLYHFVDDIGIVIRIDPVTKSFSFEKTVDFLFKLCSDTFSPLDYPDHFKKMYLRFRKIVSEKIAREILERVEG